MKVLYKEFKENSLDFGAELESEELSAFDGYITNSTLSVDETKGKVGYYAKCNSWFSDDCEKIIDIKKLTEITAYEKVRFFSAWKDVVDYVDRGGYEKRKLGARMQDLDLDKILPRDVIEKISSIQLAGFGLYASMSISKKDGKYYLDIFAMDKD